MGGTAVHRTKWAAVAAAVIVLGAAGCGTGNASTGASALPPSPRPKGTGLLTKEVVRADLDTSAADAGAPASVPEFAGMNEDAEAGSLRSCGIGFKGFGTETTTVDVARYDAVVRELRERTGSRPRSRRSARANPGRFMAPTTSSSSAAGPWSQSTWTKGTA